MKKKFIIPLSVAAMTLASVTAVSAAQEPAVQPQYGVVSDYEMGGASNYATYGQFKYSVNSNNEAVINGLTDEAASDTDIHLIIPAKINGYNVTRIENSAFQNNVNIKSVVFSEGLKTIGYNAFNGCVNLTGTITIPSTVIRVGDTYKSGAFNNTSISKVVFKEGTSKIIIGNYAFSDCKSLTEVNLSSNVSDICDGAFKNDSSLENITLKAGAYILKIYDKAFMNTSIKNVVFPENTLTIGADAFNGDVELTSITLNERLRTIGEGAFNGCNNLSGKLVIPSTVTKIGYDMYSSGAFADTSITSVEIKDGSEGLTINGSTFKNCKMLESVSLSDRIVSIGYYAFENDSNLSSVEFKEVQSNLTIGNSAFHNTAIKEVKLPSKTKTIGRYAFKDCAKLEKIEFNEGLTSIGESAFTNCTSLGGVINIPSTVTLIETSYGDGAFYNTDIFGVVIADGNSGINIGVNAFNGCKKLVYADLSNRVTNIGYGAFKDDTSLQWVKIKKDNYDLSIDTYAFQNAKSLEKISIPKRTTIKSSTFKGCTGLKNVYYSGSEKDYSNYVSVNEYENSAYKKATLTYNYTDYDTWEVPSETDSSLNGLAQNENGVWKNYKNGKVDTEYTGLVEYNGIWFYVAAGEIDWGYAGLVEYNGIWFYVSGGMIDWNYTGLTYYADVWFYVSGGVVDWNYVGLTYYNDIWFYVSDGMVDWSYSGLVYYNGAWFAVSGGTINWTTTLVEYNGMWFYVSGGMVDWDYTGTYVFYGNTFNIVGGVVVW